MPIVLDGTTGIDVSGGSVVGGTTSLSGNLLLSNGDVYTSLSVSRSGGTSGGTATMAVGAFSNERFALFALTGGGQIRIGDSGLVYHDEGGTNRTVWHAGNSRPVDGIADWRSDAASWRKIGSYSPNYAGNSYITIVSRRFDGTTVSVDTIHLTGATTTTGVWHSEGSNANISEVRLVGNTLYVYHGTFFRGEVYLFDRAGRFTVDFAAETPGAGTSLTKVNRWTSDNLVSASGAWTPVLGGFTGITYGGNRFGRFTRIGNMLKLWGRMHVTACTAAATGITISGLPYSIVSSRNVGAISMFTNFNVSNNATRPILSFWATSTTSLAVYRSGGGVGWEAATGTMQGSTGFEIMIDVVCELA